jgi:EAL domain-containing protein (putative c-di-GMP-specific phosphodiesterase class I)
MEAASQVEVVGDKILASLNHPYILGSHECHNTPSIGAALFNAHQSTIDELLKQADIAMYQSKTAGRNRLRFFDPKMQDSINARVLLEGELRKAIDARQFLLHYQVQVDVRGHPIGAEALIRWEHPVRGIVSPAHFISLAEDSGIILPLGEWILNTACAQLKVWQTDPGKSQITLAVNVSPRQFRQPDFAAQVLSAVTRHDIDPRLLKLELTESLFLDDIGETITTMSILHEEGIQFSLDDFGTGYSSLQYLKRLPLNQLKIDQSFVRDIVSDNSDREIVGTIIAMAKNLKLSVIAEGVETEEQLQLLKNSGCLSFQGYLFSKPLSLREFELMFNEMKKA